MVFEFVGSIAMAPMFRTGKRSVRGFHVLPPSVVFQTPPVTAPAYMTNGLVGSIRILRVLPPMFPGPRLVHPLPDDEFEARGCVEKSASPGLPNEKAAICL